MWFNLLIRFWGPERESDMAKFTQLILLRMRYPGLDMKLRNTDGKIFHIKYVICFLL